MLSREVSADEIKAAEFQNFQNLGDASRKVISTAGLAGLHPDSPAYGRLMTRLMNNENSLRGMGYDPYRNAQVSQVAAQNAVADEMAITRGPDFNPYLRAAGRALGMNVPEPRRVPVQRSAPAGSGGSAITTGMVNGERRYVPKAGHYTTGEFQEQMAAVSPEDSTYGVSVEGVRDYQKQQAAALGAENERKRRLGRLEKFNDEQNAHQRAMQLEGLKNAPEMLKAGQEGSKDAGTFHRERLEKWNTDQVKANQLLGMVEGMPDVDPETGTPNRLMDERGNMVPVAALRAQARALNYPKPTYEDSLVMLGTPGSMAELSRLGKGQLEQPKDQGGNWLDRGLKAGAEMMGRVVDKTGKQLSSRRQVMATMSAAEKRKYDKLTPEKQAEFWRLAEL